MASDPFAELARDLPDGAFWVTGTWLRQVFAALTADRARPGANLDEHPTDKGRFFNAKAGGTAAPTSAPEPWTVVRADGEDAHGASHPGRVRVYNGRLNDFLPDEMDLPDAELPNGTDNRCFLTMSEGPNYVYGKLLYEDGTPQSASVYRVDSPEEADGTYLYFLAATVTYADGALTIVQEGTGNQSSAPYSSADGETIYPDW